MSSMLLSLKNYLLKNLHLQKDEDSLTKQLARTWKAMSKQEQASQYKMMEAAKEAEVLQIGETIPNFRLPNAVGKGIRAKNLLRNGPLIISFYRGNWCPFCRLELEALEQIYPAIRAMGANLIAISPQTPEQLTKMIQKKAYSFELLSDMYNELAREFGVVFRLDDSLDGLFKEFGIPAPLHKEGLLYELPIPATFIISQHGKIFFRYVEPDYTKRIEPKYLIKVLSALDDEQTT